MAEKPTKGTVVAFGNTPQAKDDHLTGLGTEDSSGILYLNVMANDLGGNGKSLWAIDDGISAGGDRPADLLVQDAVGAVGTSALGAELWITADGKVAYRLTAAMIDSFQSLSVGQSIADSFTYAIQLGNGALSWARVNMTLAGTNDRPIVQNVSVAAIEDGTAVSGSFAGDDIDSDDDPGSLVYTITAQPATGTMTQSGTSFTYAPGSNFQELAAGETSLQSFTYTATDKHGAVSAPATGSITVTGVNDAPTLKAGASELVEDGATLTVDLAALGADIDSDDDGITLHYAVLGSVPGGSAVISGTTLSLSPGADFQELAEGETADFAVMIEATDAHGATATNAIAVTVTGANDAPTLQAGTLAVHEDGDAVTLNLASHGNDVDSDDDGSTLAYAVTGPATGTASVSGTTLSFAPDDDFQWLAHGETASVVLDVTATDRHGASAASKVTVTVAGVNDAPVITSDAAAATGSVAEDSVLVASGTLTASDVDLSDTLSWSINGAASSTYGTLGIDGSSGKWTYALGNTAVVQNLAHGESVTDTFSVRVADGQGGTDDQVVTLAIAGTNDAPTMQAGSLTTSEDGPGVNLNLAALADDIDNDDTGGSLTYTLLSPAPQGSLVITGSGLNFNPGAAYQGLAQGETKNIPLLIEAKDSHGATTTNTVTLTVNGLNDAPTLAGGDVSGAVQAKVPVQPFTVQQWTGYFGPYNFASITAHAAANAANYTTSTGIIDYTDDPSGFAGEFAGSFPWPAAQATGANGVDATVNNHFFAKITGQINVGTADTYTFRTFNDDGVRLRVNGTQVLIDEGQHPESAREGSIALQPGTWPIELYFFENGGEASLEFSYKNSSGVYSHVNLDPMLRDTGIINFGDVDLSDAHTVSVAPVGTALGMLSANVTKDTTNGTPPGDVRWDYAVDNNSAAVRNLGAGETRTDTFAVTISDGKGGSVTQQVAVTVAGINDAPTAVNDTNALTVLPSAQVSTNTVKWVDWTQTIPGGVKGVIDLGGGQTVDVTYTGQYYFAQTNGGTSYYTTPATQPWDLTLGTGTYTSAGVANGPAGSDIIALSQATTRTLNFSQPVDDLFFAVVSLNGNGYRFDQDFDILSYGRGFFDNGGATKNVLPDGRYELLSVANSHGTSELHGVLGIKGSVNTLTWDSLSNETWNGFTVGTYGKAQTAVASGNLLANDTDPDGDVLSVATVNGQVIAGNSITLTLGSGARLTVNKNGTYSYDENGAFAALGAGQNAADTFTYSVKDSHGAHSNLATATINLTGVNDAPRAIADSVTAQEDLAIAINVLGNDSDPDAGDTLSLHSVTNGTHGSVSIVAGKAVYQPQANFVGNDSFSYTVKDALGATSTATVAVTVKNVVDTHTPANLVKNGSFEAGTANWATTGNGVDVVGGWQAADGTLSIDLNAFSPGGVKQALATEAGKQYFVSFMLSKNPGGGSQTYFDTARVTAGDYGADHSFNLPNTATNMMWQQKSFSFVAGSSSSELSFSSLTPQGFDNGDVREGPALDEVVVVSTQVIEGFNKGAGGDVLNLSTLLTSIGAPHDATAFSQGFVRFELTGGGTGTLVSIDANGGGDHFLPVVALVGTALLQSDTGNFVL